MGKKPKNSLDAIMVKNAKRKQASKTKGVRYPNADEVKNLLNIHVSNANKEKE